MVVRRSEMPVFGETLKEGCQVIAINPARMVVISLASRLTGLTERAINSKIDNGDWIEGEQWHRGPDGRRYVDLEAYTLWVRGKRSSTARTHR